LYEDEKWRQLNDEEVISLLSQPHDGDSLLSETSKKIREGLYPLIFLSLFILTNIVPPVVGCLKESNSTECLFFNHQNKRPSNEVLYQVIFQ